MVEVVMDSSHLGLFFIIFAMGFVAGFSLVYGFVEGKDL